MSEFEPSDWKATRIPKLAQLDSLQRCLICKDFLKAPVSTSCNHTFCSQCIRQHLMSVSSCPLCKSEQFESNLKRAILLEEIVLCFQALREDLISAVASPPDARHTKEASETPEIAANIEIIEVPDENPGPNSTPGPEQKLPPGYVSCPVCNLVMKEEHVQGSHLDYCLNGVPDPKLVAKATPTKRQTNDVVSFFQPQKRQKVAPKPARSIDHEKFYFSEGSKHQHEAKRIPKVDFASLSTGKIREKLAAYKLSTLGSRPELEWRYNHYYLLQQSNLDSNRPVSDMELRQKLKQWEVSHSATPASTATNTIYGDALSRKSMADKDFPVKAWLCFYRKEFRRLVKQARRSQRKREKNGEDGDGDRHHGASSPEPSALHAGISPAPTADSTSQNSTAPQRIPGSPDPGGVFKFSESVLFTPQ